MEEAQAYFERVAERWDEMRRDFFPDSLRDRFRERLEPAPEMIVADVGCGTGFLAGALAPHVARVHCIDASAPMLAQARVNLAAFANVEYHLADGSRLPLANESVDAAVANMYLHHAPDPALAVREMARVLRPGGRLFLADSDAHQESWMRVEMADLWLGFDRDDVRRWLEEAGLTEVFVGDCDSF